MKRKTINSIIQRKVNDWLDSIEDEELVRKLREDIIITGGCITSMLLNEPVNDYDIYFKTKETTKMVAQYYADRFNKNNENRTNGVGASLRAWVLDGQDVEDWKNNKKSLSSFAEGYPNFLYSKYLEYSESGEHCKRDVEIVKNQETDEEEFKVYGRVSGMLTNTPINRIKMMINSAGVAEDSDSIADNVEYDIEQYLEIIDDADDIPASNMEDQKEKYRPIFLSTNAITLSNKIQLIIRFYGEPEEIHENYDFIHVTNYWTSATGVVLNQRALEAILNKELFYMGSKYPIASLIRTRKFIKRGWQINAGQYVKMAWQVSELDLSDVYVLEDQLVGVDSIYFLNFISQLKDRMLKDKEFKLTGGYLVTVIDKIFQ